MINTRYTAPNSIVVLLLLVIVLTVTVSCNNGPQLYKKEFTEQEKQRLPDQMTTNLIKKYNQGTVSEILVLQEALIHKPKDAGLWREIGIPYGKRGLAAEFYENYGKAAKYDPLGWQGWRGYMYLYFYRDYKRAIKDFDELDALTPKVVDYPQATSIHYMRGVCYLQLGNYDKAHEYWNIHIEEELKTLEEEYIDLKTFLFQGITYYKQGEFGEAKKSIDRALKYHTSTADLYYWSAKIANQQNDLAAAKKAIKKSKYYFNLGSFNSRGYVEEFYQANLLDIIALEEAISSREIN